MQEQMKGSKKIRKGDQVCVIAGNAKGQSGKVLFIAQDRVVVEGVNLRKKHVKRSQKHPEGGIVDLEQPIHISNLAPCDKEGNRLKVKVQVNEQGEREFYYIENGERCVWRSVKR